MLIKGQVGIVDNIRTILIPQSYLPTNVEFIVTHGIGTIAAQKLSEYKIHDNPPGINGWLVEGRVYYDAFVLKKRYDVRTFTFCSDRLYLRRGCGMETQGTFQRDMVLGHSKENLLNFGRGRSQRNGCLYFGRWRGIQNSVHLLLFSQRRYQHDGKLCFDRGSCA